jgi:hypothetical protein
MLNDITRHSSDNLGGVNAFKFVPAKGVNPLPASLNGAIHHELTLKDGYRWYTGYCTEFTMNYKESPVQSEHGLAYKKTFSGKVPNDRSDLTWLFDEMKDQGFILDITDNNGQRKIVGNPDEPVYFVSTLDTKAEMAQRNEHEIVFEGEGIDKAPFYNI